MLWKGGERRGEEIGFSVLFFCFDFILFYLILIFFYHRYALDTLVFCFPLFFSCHFFSLFAFSFLFFSLFPFLL